jgi:catechol 2,3-dioxygenase-like lactoylglutathione lyase family enzyme
MIESIRAVTLEVADMARSTRFYDALGFVLRYGGPDATFTSYNVGSGYLNLELKAEFTSASGWGRTIFYVSDVDEIYALAIGAGLKPSTAPRDASWGERFFHISDPDGHEMSFARLLG